MRQTLWTLHLLCQKEEWRTQTSCGLSTTQQSHYRRCNAPTNHPDHPQQDEREETVQPIRYSVGVQQHLNCRRRPMENRLQNHSWSLSVKHNELWTLQCTGNILPDGGKHF